MTTETTDRLARAAETLNATDLGDGRWAYYADEVSRYCVVSAADLAELCDYLDHADEEIARSAYSHWCAGNPADEMDADWSPDSPAVDLVYYVATDLDTTAIYGMGNTAAEALADAAEWTDSDDLVTIRATPALADLVRESGGHCDVSLTRNGRETGTPIDRDYADQYLADIA